MSDTAPEADMVSGWVKAWWLMSTGPREA